MAIFLSFLNNAPLLFFTSLFYFLPIRPSFRNVYMIALAVEKLILYFLEADLIVHLVLITSLTNYSLISMSIWAYFAPLLPKISKNNDLLTWVNWIFIWIKVINGFSNISWAGSQWYSIFFFRNFMGNTSKLKWLI